jgi:23S rRNA pseudouridine1911/1915/1917 synthase
MNLNILFEDNDLLIINKPSGLIVNESKNNQENLFEILKDFSFIKKIEKSYQELIPQDFEKEYGTPEEIFKNRNGIAHRLDKETSGVILVAKNPGCLVNLLDQFKKRQVKKYYLGLVHGHFNEDSGFWNTQISRNKRNRRQFIAFEKSESGREAKTFFQLKGKYQINWEKFKEFGLKRKLVGKIYQDFNLVEFNIQTGRTHQIRVQSKYFNHTIVGDKLYASKKQAELDILWCKRQFLHSSRIEFRHPRTCELIKIEADLTKDLQESMNFLNN